MAIVPLLVVLSGLLLFWQYRKIYYSGREMKGRSCEYCTVIPSLAGFLFLKPWHYSPIFIWNSAP